MKVLVLILLFSLPPIMEEGMLCSLMMMIVAVEFWLSKNLGRKFLNASWYIETDGEEDQWVYEAGMSSPTELYENIFWYSFILYGILLIPMLLLTFFDHKLSLSCVVLTAIVANYINFYAFSTIITVRN